MKKHIILAILGGWLFLFSCKSDTSAPPTEPKPTKKVDTLPQSKSLTNTLAIPSSHDCTVRGKMVEENDFWIPEEQLWICIVADNITRDIDFGDSYRIFDVYDTKNCSQLKRKVLPVNNSPDFPWYLFQNTYEEKNQVICTSGFEFTFCYDVENRKLLPRMKPEFLLPRTALDAQTGLTLSMAVYDSYLFGYAQDLGFFAYDLTDKKNVKTFLPISEYHLKKDNQFHSLFLLPSGNKTYQAIIPTLDQNEGKISLSTLWKKPISVDPLVAKNVRNNRFQILTDLRSPNKTKVALDLGKQKSVDLPAKISTASVKEILNYLKTKSR